MSVQLQYALSMELVPTHQNTLYGHLKMVRIKDVNVLLNITYQQVLFIIIEVCFIIF